MKGDLYANNYIMGQGYPHFSSTGEHIGAWIKNNPKAILLALAASGLLFLAMNDKRTNQVWAQKNNPTSVADSASAAADKIDDETAASVLMMNSGISQ